MRRSFFLLLTCTLGACVGDCCGSSSSSCNFGGDSSGCNFGDSCPGTCVAADAGNPCNASAPQISKTGVCSDPTTTCCVPSVGDCAAAGGTCVDYCSGPAQELPFVCGGLSVCCSASDAGVDAGDASPSSAPDILALNNLLAVQSSVRFCFAASATGTPSLQNPVDMDLQPGGSGLSAGAIAPLQVPSLAGMTSVVVFAYYTQSLISFGYDSSPCPAVFAASELTDNGDAGLDASQLAPRLMQQTVDFDVSGIIPAAVFSSSKVLLYATGCPLTSDLALLGDPLFCGPSNDAGGASTGIGDFHVYALGLSPLTPDAGALVQGVNGETTDLYFGPGAFSPYNLGFAYADVGQDAGADAQIPPGVWLDGPDLEAGTGVGGFAPIGGNGPLLPGTLVPSLSGVSDALLYISNQGRLRLQSIGDVTTLSGLTATDLTNGKAFTLVVLGSRVVSTTLPDGGPNPLAIGFRLIRNDTP